MTVGFSEELWDKFDVVTKKVRSGKNFTGTVGKFLQKRAQIESVYAKSLIKLCKDKAFSVENEVGTLRDCWQVLRDETENFATKHDTLADQLNALSEAIQVYLNEGKKPRKTLVANGEKVTRELKNSEVNESKSKINYEKLKKKQEETEDEATKVSGTTKEAKAKKGAEQAAKKAEIADNEYKEAVKQLQIAQQKFYHDEMPKILDDLQKFEEDRMDKTSDWFNNIVKAQESIPPAITSATENMQTSCKAINREADVRNFVQSTKSGATKPPEAKYEPYGTSSNQRVEAIDRSVSTSSFNSFKRADTQSSMNISNGSNGSSLVIANGASTTNVDRCTVRAIYDYTATEENELSFKANDRIAVLQKDQSGWWQGELNGSVGMFPSNFVELDGSSNSNQLKGQCKALYDYNAESDSELTIKEGDVLTIESEDDGWLFGANPNGTCGRFPSNYVEML